ncbi:MAG: hypothetical protein IKZ88_08445 [Neisseriaceae bacterium]|nr:hypothetical protein [Neisseriaceae bacterium]
MTDICSDNASTICSGSLHSKSKRYLKTTVLPQGKTKHLIAHFSLLIAHYFSGCLKVVQLFLIRCFLYKK